MTKKDGGRSLGIIMQKDSLKLTFKNKKIIFLLLFFILIAFILTYYLEAYWDSKNIFNQVDILFNTDPSLRLSAFVDGSGTDIAGGILHPNLSNFFNIPIRILSKGIHILNFSRSSELTIRRSLGLCISPIFSSLKVLLLIILFNLLGFSFFQISALTILCILSFSEIIFGSVPDHFIIIGSLIVFLYIIFVNNFEKSKNSKWITWVFTGIVFAGISIFSLVFFILFCYITLYLVNKNVIKATLLTASIVIIVLLVTILLSNIGNAVYKRKSTPNNSFGEYLEAYIVKSPMKKIKKIPDALINTIAPLDINTIKQKARYPEYNFIFTLDNSRRNTNFLSFLTIVFITLGAIRGLAHNPSFRILTFLSLAILIFNLIFFAFWGDEYFLYSQYWLIPLIFLMSGNMLFKGRISILVKCLFLIYIIMIFFNNISLLHKLCSGLNVKISPELSGI